MAARTSILHAGSRIARDAALRAFARAGTALTMGGRYHEPGPLLDRALAAAFGYGNPFSRRDGAPLPIEPWEAACRAAPNSPICRARLASMLRKAGEFDRAREVIADALTRFPHDLGTSIEAARLAERRGEHADAARHWQRVIGKGRPRRAWLAGAAQALVSSGRLDEAEAFLRDARAAHPRNPDLMAAACTLAVRKRDWAKAVALSRDYRHRFPSHSRARDLLGESIYAQTLSKIDALDDGASVRATRVDAGSVEDAEARELLLQFESIGENCEFGLVQRRFGAEPLGLFRWNRVDASDLVAALHHRLEGLGEPENTEMITITSGEFFVLDRRWFLGMHTFLFADQISHDELYPAMLRRTVALRDRFVKDLAAGEKILVFLSSGLERQALLDLHRAFAAFGPVRLLAVQPAQAPAPAAFAGRPGDIHVVEPGCWVGFLRRRGVEAGVSWNIAFDDWIAICGKAQAQARAEASGREAIPCLRPGPAAIDRRFTTP